MIANARMYSVSPEAGGHWRMLLSAIGAQAGVDLSYMEYAAPAPLDALWQRPDLGAVFMCGLPFARAAPPLALVAAPVPAPVEFADQPRYWSDWVVREDSAYRTVSDTYGGRLAFTVPGSQSGCVAGLSYFMVEDAQRPLRRPPLFGEIIAPTITPLGALSAVIRGDADIAPLDAYALRLLRQYRPDLTSQVRVIGQTAPTPIPPLVATPIASEPLAAAFLEAHENATIRVLLEPLLLRRFVRPEAAAYQALRSRFEAATAYWRARPLAAVTDPAFVL
jgi:ABC-type phosphate/phosphonate transport system substrate-binding protein